MCSFESILFSRYFNTSTFYHLAHAFIQSDLQVRHEYQALESSGTNSQVGEESARQKSVVFPFFPYN